MPYFFVLLIAGVVLGAPPCLPPQNCSFLWRVEKNTSMEIFSSHPLEKTDSDIKKLVVTVHGVLRNANDYYAWMLEAAQLEGFENSALILAPHFKSDEDPKTQNELFWASEDWKLGGPSSNEEEKNKISSFLVMDSLVKNIILSQHFPNLKDIILIGHSAGGQYLSRYAVTGKLELKTPTHYIISNPSSYLYLTEIRPNEDPECPTFNDYGYGLKNRNLYSSEVPDNLLIDRFLSRKVTLLLGEKDTENASLDMGCEANLQGKNRWERGKNFFAYIHSSFPGAQLKKIVVPGVGHDSQKMYQSPEGRKLLFK